MSRAISRSRLVIATLIGNTLEWYEFSLYLHFLPLFSILFFPSSSNVSSLLYGFMVFAVGFISRPLGSLFFGSLGDRFGRKFALILTITLMCVPTFCIGLLPTFAQIGIMAPLLLTLLRLLQGIPSGGEFPGVMCFLVESAGPGQRGWMGSWAFVGSQIGSIVSTLEIFLLQRKSSIETLTGWDWRLPFIIGGLLGLFGWYLRRSLHETTAFQGIEDRHKLTKTPIRDALRTQSRPLFRGFFLAALPLAGWYLVFVFSPLYASQVLGITPEKTLFINILMLTLCSILLPFVGKLTSSRHLAPSALLVALIAPFYFWVSQMNFATFLSLQILLIFCLSVHFALLPSVLAELFPTPVRYTCMGISYNLCNIFFGGAAPFLALTLFRATASPIPPGLLLSVCALVTLLALRTNGRSGRAQEK